MGSSGAGFEGGVAVVGVAGDEPRYPTLGDPVVAGDLGLAAAFDEYGGDDQAGFRHPWKAGRPSLRDSHSPAPAQSLSAHPGRTPEQLWRRGKSKLRKARQAYRRGRAISGWLGSSLSRHRTAGGLQSEDELEARWLI